jgi:hypothetical protein
MDLFSQYQSTLLGNQAGNAMAQGTMPSSSAPRGSQQLWIAAIGATRQLISDSNKLADSLRRCGCEEEDREVIKITHQYQGVLDKLKARISDMQQGVTNAA